MRITFWVAALVVFYSYLGYPLLLYIWSRLRLRPIRRGAYLPSISIIMSVRNEAAVLEAKLRNLAALDYPRGKMEVIVVSDGSTDTTADILRAHAGPGLRFLDPAEARGKALAINDAVAQVHGEIVVFTDARQQIEPGAVRALLGCFADTTVGCVSGELMFENSEADATAGVGLYWAVEKKIRAMEALVGSTIGATGAFYAVRRNLIRRLPAGTLLDDVLIPMQVVKQGYRVSFEPGAIAWDQALADSDCEFRRKVRTLTGNYQLLRLMPWLLMPCYPVWFQFVSHKLTRLLVPFALAACLISSGLCSGALYRSLFVAQLFAYIFAGLAFCLPQLGPLTRLGNMARTFLVLNTAAVVAFFNFMRRKEEVWTR